MNTESFPSTERSLSLSELGPVLRRWWWLMLPPVALALVVVTVLTSQATRLYSAEAEVVIRTEESANLFPLSEATALLRSPSTEEGFLASTEYETEAQLRAGTDASVEIDVGNLDSRVDPSFISFTATGDDPEVVTNTARIWAETYIDLRHQRDELDVSQTVATLQETATSLDAERVAILEALAPIDRLLNVSDDGTEVARLSTQRVALLQSIEPQLTPIDRQLDAINDELASLQLIQNFLSTETVSARMNRLPSIPESPVSPSLSRNLAFGLFGALILAGAAVLVAEARDDRVRSADQLSTESGLSYLSTIPLKRRDDGMASARDHGPLAESFQRLASSIGFTRVGESDNQVLMFTSARARESKTTTVARLGMVLAHQGQRTIVIGADLRRPTLDQRFVAPDSFGLAEYLEGDRQLDQCIAPVSSAPNLSILPAGIVSGDHSPAELLRSPRMAELIESLREDFEHILMDCPPILPVVDALEIAKLCDGIVLGAFVSRTKMGQFDQALNLLYRSTDTPVLGYVLTGVKEGSSYYSDSYYSRPQRTSTSRAAAIATSAIPEIDLVDEGTSDEMAAQGVRVATAEEVLAFVGSDGRHKD